MMRWLTILCIVPFLGTDLATGAMVALTVAEPSGVRRSGWPVTSGVPMAQGALRDPAAVVLRTRNGREVPLQTEVLARWPDGSIRWLLLDFQVDLPPSESISLELHYGAGSHRAEVAQPVRVIEEAGDVALNTGPLQLRLSTKAFRLFDAVWLDTNRDGVFDRNEQITQPGGTGINLTTPDGRRFRADAAPARLTVEQAGPLRACVRVEGRLASVTGSMFRYVVRVHAFRGQPFVRFHYTFINDNPDALMARIDAMNLAVGVRPADNLSYVLNGKSGSAGHLFQIDDRRGTINGQPTEERMPGWAALGGRNGGLAVGVREFRQNWPKSIGVGDGALSVGLCPPFDEGLYDGRPLEDENKLYYWLRDGVYTFKVGVARTHEMWANFFAGPPDATQLANFFGAAEDPLLATCDPAHVSSSRARGDLPAAGTRKHGGYDAWLSRALDAHLERREQGREYGMLNYGDWYGERKVNWGNLEYDLAHGLFLQYLRTGDRRFFLRAEQAARHHIDVDVVHATNAHLKNPWGPAPRVGEIWLHCLNHTGGYYEDAPLPVSRTYQMGHSTNFGHVWVSGDLDYYYLTGDRRARDVAIQIADAMVRHCPTRYGTHIRALGWPMILVLDAYEATGDKKYLEAATKNWHVLRDNIDWQKGWVVRLARGHCLHDDLRCYGNVPFMEGLTLCALARYHRATGDPKVLEAISVGIDQMIRECWQEEFKTFSYTPCPLSSRKPYALFMLSVEAMAYEARLTGNREHLRILREGFRAAIPDGDGASFGKSLAQMIHFAPHALTALED